VNDWDRRFLQMAALVASWSKDPSTQAGCVLVDSNNRVMSVGFNGLPRGAIDSYSMLNNREIKYKVIIHAEENALLFSDLSSGKDLKAYVYPLPPCARCASKLIQAGVKHIVTVKPSEDLLTRWGDDFALAESMYTQADVNITIYDSLTLT